MMMLERIQKSPLAKIGLVAVLVIAGIGVAYEAKALWGSSSVADAAGLRWFVCAETKKSFQSRLELGMSVPVESPYSGKATGFPAELCYWTKEGVAKSDPTPVLLNTYVGEKEPTFCPECGRLVIGHNPSPAAGSHAPPTREEWEKAQKLRTESGTK